MPITKDRIRLAPSTEPRSSWSFAIAVDIFLSYQETLRGYCQLIYPRFVHLWFGVDGGMAGYVSVCCIQNQYGNALEPTVFEPIGCCRLSLQGCQGLSFLTSSPEQIFQKSIACTEINWDRCNYSHWWLIMWHYLELENNIWMESGSISKEMLAVKSQNWRCRGSIGKSINAEFLRAERETLRVFNQLTQFINGEQMKMR